MGIIFAVILHPALSLEIVVSQVHLNHRGNVQLGILAVGAHIISRKVSCITVDRNFITRQRKSTRSSFSACQTNAATNADHIFRIQMICRFHIGSRLANCFIIDNIAVSNRQVTAFHIQATTHGCGVIHDLTDLFAVSGSTDRSIGMPGHRDAATSVAGGSIVMDITTIECKR